MSLPWVRLDTAFPRHPKVLSLASERHWQAIASYVSGLAYSGEQGSDGFIPAVSLPWIHGTKRTGAQLADVGLWIPKDGGWQVNGWDEFQPSDAETQSRRQRLIESSRKANCVRWHGPDCGCWRIGGSDA